MNIAASIGHNKPSLTESLKDSTQKLAESIDALAKRADQTPRQINAPSDLLLIGELVKDTTALSKQIEDRRKTEKDPFLNAGREVDNFFGVMSDRLDRIKKAFQKIADDYARAKANEERIKREEEAAKLRAEEERKRREIEDAKRLATKERKEIEAETIAAKAEEMEEAANATIKELAADAIGMNVGAPWTFEITDFNAIPLDVLRPYFKREEIEKAIRQYIRQGHRDLNGVSIYQDVKARFK